MKEIIGSFRFRKRYKIMINISLNVIILTFSFRSFEMREKWDLSASKIIDGIMIMRNNNKKYPTQMIYIHNKNGFYKVIHCFKQFENFLWEYRMIIPKIDYNKIGGLMMMEALK